MEGVQKTRYPLGLLFLSMILCFIPIFRSKYMDKHVDEIRSIDVNGVNIVYQIKGREGGKPVILLHGNGGEHDHLSVMVEQLDSAGYLVYALDSRGQGANAPVEEYHYVDMAEALNAVVSERSVHWKSTKHGDEQQSAKCEWTTRNYRIREEQRKYQCREYQWCEFKKQ